VKARARRRCANGRSSSERRSEFRHETLIRAWAAGLASFRQAVNRKGGFCKCRRADGHWGDNRFPMRHHDRGSPEKPEKGKRQAPFWEARRRLGQPRGTSVFAAPCRAALTARIHAEASRDQSAEDWPRAEPTGVRHRVENPAGGRRNDTGAPGVGIRGSPRSLLLGTETGSAPRR
jgi:hypothetical protein